MIIYHLYRAYGNLYRINKDTDMVELGPLRSGYWTSAFASADTVRNYGQLVAKNVVFK